jgi:hypothetical protein
MENGELWGQIVGYGLLGFSDALFSGYDRICEAEGGL